MIKLGHTSIFLLIIFSLIPSCSQQEVIRSLPEACIAAKCMMENEWVNPDQLYSLTSLNDSGKCVYNDSAAFHDDWSPMLPGLPEIKAPKKLALQHITVEFFFFCGPDANEGCSLKRRFMATWYAMLYWHRWGNIWIPHMFSKGEGLKSMWQVSQNYFPIFVAPLFLLSHFLNIVVLKKMLVEDKTAIVFHLAEVISDMASVFYSLSFSLCFHVFAAYCTKVSESSTIYDYQIFKESGFDHLYHLDRWPTWEIMLNCMCGFQSANQLYNLYLIISRWYSVTYPAGYLKLNRKKSLMITLETAMFCIILAIWPGKPVSCDKKIESFYLYMYPMFKDSEFVLFLFNAKSRLVFVMYTTIFVAQIFFGAVFFYQYRKFMRSNYNVQHETEDQANARKQVEKDKALLMIGTIIVNWICMFPTVMATITEAVNYKYKCLDDANYGIKLNEWMDFWKSMQLFASGFNAIGNFIIHLTFTMGYRNAFKMAVIDPIAKVFRKVHVASVSYATHPQAVSTQGPTVRQAWMP